MKTFEYTAIPYEKINQEYCNQNFFNEDFRKGFEEYLEKQCIKDSVCLFNQKLSTNNYVGVIKYKNFQLDVLPKLLSRTAHKIDKNGDNCYEQIREEDISIIIKNLLFMISKTDNFDIKTTDYADISNCDNPFFEILIREYANSLFESLKRLTPKNYVRVENNLNYLKGKLKFSENIKYNCVNKARFYCEYDEFSENNTLNKLFLYVSKCLFKVSKNSKNKQTLSFIMNYFSELPFEQINKYEAEKIILTRNQKLFELPFRLAKMFLNHISVDISKNTIENITILWDMNKLFEEFIYQLLRKGQNEYKVNFQKQYKLLKKLKNNGEEGSEFRDTYTDIFLEKDDKKIVIDTKYKIGSFANTDIYQVSTYCLLHKAENAILFYPTQYDRNSSNEFFTYKKQSYKLNSKDNNVFIHKVYVNLYHDNLKEIFNRVDEFVNILKEIENICHLNNISLI